MNKDDYMNYWLPVAEKFASEAMRQGDVVAGDEIDNLLGCTHFAEYMKRAYFNDFPMADDLKRLLVLLAGPHGATILKVYRIQKGLE